MGFCLYNNVAIAARAATRKLGARRVFIFDWDVHHGNGTQDAFYEDPSVLYMSVHQSPLYPGTGRVRERGARDGEGFNVNIPLPPGCGDAEHLYAVQEICVPVLKKFNPDIVMLSAGFDAHRDDPLASQNLSTEGFARMARMIQEGAESTGAAGKMVALLEGGYNQGRLAQSVVAVMSAWYNRTPGESPTVSDADRVALDRVREIRSAFPEWER